MEVTEDPSFEVEFLSTSGVYKTSFSLIILVQFFIGGMILLVVNLWFVNHIYFLLTGNQFYPIEPKGTWFEWLLLPLNIYGNLYLFAFSVTLFSGGLYRLLNRIHAPKEGIFEKGSKEWKYTHRRFWTAYFPIWIMRALPFPWLDIVSYRVFGVRIGRNVVAYEGYIDPEFVEIGDHTMTSLHICIFSHLIYHDKIVIKKVKIGKNCVVGPQTIIFPGTTMNDGAILGANSYTSIGQELKGELIHIGNPVDKEFTVQSVEEAQMKAEKAKKSKKNNHEGGDE